ncbi:MAG TPA: hypothetical protein VIU37_09210, partial [Candidatus Limnocylindrales bacterium]
MDLAMVFVLPLAFGLASLGEAVHAAVALTDREAQEERRPDHGADQANREQFHRGIRSKPVVRAAST